MSRHSRRSQSRSQKCTYPANLAIALSMSYRAYLAAYSNLINIEAASDPNCPLAVALPPGFGGADDDLLDLALAEALAKFPAAADLALPFALGFALG